MREIKIGDIRLNNDAKNRILKVLESCRFSEGSQTREFESLWSKYIGTKYCVAVNSGTSALILGLYSLLYDERFKKVKRGSKVITSPVTYAATSNAIILAGLEPVYVDIDAQTFKLDVNQIESLLKKSDPDNYSIILPVHLMGYPNDMDEINCLAEKYDLVVFEDAAQAHGSLYKGKKVGSLSLLSDYSFYIAHNIQVGELGALLTSDARLRTMAKMVKANGRMCACEACTRMSGGCPHKEYDYDPRFTHEYIGFNFKTTEFQPAIAISQLAEIENIISIRQKNVKLLNELLCNYENKIQLPIYSADISYLAYPIILKDKRINRSNLMNKLEEQGIESRTLFGCLPTQQRSFARFKDVYANKLPNADHIGGRGLYIACHQYLTTEDINYMSDVVIQLLGSEIYNGE